MWDFKAPQSVPSLGVWGLGKARSLRKARVGPDAEDGTTRARVTSQRTLAFWRDRFLLGHFDDDFLQIFELKCTKW
jgi:hypothetical protein